MHHYSNLIDYTERECVKKIAQPLPYTSSNLWDITNTTYPNPQGLTHLDNNTIVAELNDLRKKGLASTEKLNEQQFAGIIDLFLGFTHNHNDGFVKQPQQEFLGYKADWAIHRYIFNDQIGLVKTLNNIVESKGEQDYMRHGIKQMVDYACIADLRKHLDITKTGCFGIAVHGINLEFFDILPGVCSLWEPIRGQGENLVQHVELFSLVHNFKEKVVLTMDTKNKDTITLDSHLTDVNLAKKSHSYALCDFAMHQKRSGFPNPSIRLR